MCKYNNNVCGFGINDVDIKVTNNKKNDKSYQTWTNMIRRCYSGKYITYAECTVSDEWKYFSNFKKWFDENYIEEFHLDKDILVKGNKVYSPDTCRFVPQYLNNLLNDCKNVNNGLPIGVFAINPSISQRRKTTTYISHCHTSLGHISKTFKTISEASSWYIENKRKHIKEVSIKAFLDNAIKTDIYLALIRREF